MGIRIIGYLNLLSLLVNDSMSYRCFSQFTIKYVIKCSIVIFSVAAKFHEEAGIFKLLIVDSIMALFRVDYSERGEILDRQQKLGQMMSRLQKISEEYNIAVFVSNQITSDFNNKQELVGNDQPKPVGGNILAHASTIKVSLRKGKGNKRIAKLHGSPDLEENEITYIITQGGIADPIN